MTFFEAALEVLRSVKRPLHYRKIAELAIKRGLLGHVGTAPVMLMGTRLLQEVLRQHNDSPLVIVDQGTFALRAWPAEMLEIREEITDSDELGLPLALRASQDNNEEELNKDDVLILLRLANEEQVSTDELHSEPSKQPITSPTQASAHAPVAQRDPERHHAEHYNVAAAIVKILRANQDALSSELIAQTLNHKFGSFMTGHNVVMALRADNALRSARGKRPLFDLVAPDSWLLTERNYGRAILRTESKIYELSRQVKSYALQAMNKKLRELSLHAWVQLATLLLRHLGYTIISQFKPVDNGVVLRAEESRGLNYVSALVKLHHNCPIEVDDITLLRELMQEYRVGCCLILTNNDLSRDAITECDTAQNPIYAYNARQCASLLVEAKIGIHHTKLPLTFVDDSFFSALHEEPNTPEPGNT